jgi:hypothetical protein
MQLLQNLKNFGCSCFFLAQAQFQYPAARRAAARHFRLVVPRQYCPASPPHPRRPLGRPRRGPCSFTIRARFRDEIVPVSRLKACTEVATTPCSPRRRSRPSGKRPGCPAATKCVLFSDLLVSLPSSSQAPPCGGPGTVFQSQTGFLHALNRRRHPSLHSSSTCTVSSHRLRLDQSLGGALWRPGYTPG